MPDLRTILGPRTLAARSRRSVTKRQRAGCDRDTQPILHSPPLLVRELLIDRSMRQRRWLRLPNPALPAAVYAAALVSGAGTSTGFSTGAIWIAGAVLVAYAGRPLPTAA